MTEAMVVIEGHEIRMKPAGPPLFEARGISKAYGHVNALMDVNFEVRRNEVVGLLSSAAVCLAPEPSNPLNDRSTMMKVAEYLAMACPVVAFDLLETRRTAEEAALYAPSGDIEAFASCIGRLLADEELRARLGAAGCERIRSSLSWEHSRHALLAAYERALQT